MPLEPGSFLGPYRVTAKIGEGGMGEVCRATDTKLKRDVAVNVLEFVRKCLRALSQAWWRLCNSIRVRRLILVQNWFEELRRLVPTN